MPISKSANKSLRVAKRQAGENKLIKNRVKQQLKKTTGDNLAEAFSILDKAAKSHVIHKNKAARLKSRLAKRIAAEAAAAPATKAKSKSATKVSATKANATKKAAKK